MCEQRQALAMHTQSFLLCPLLSVLRQCALTQHLAWKPLVPLVQAVLPQRSSEVLFWVVSNTVLVLHVPAGPERLVGYWQVGVTVTLWFALLLDSLPSV